MSPSRRSLKWETKHERHDGKWKVEVETPYDKGYQKRKREKAKRKREKAKRKILAGTLEAATKLIEEHCPPELIKRAEASEEVDHVRVRTKGEKIVGLDVFVLDANAGVASASASAKISPAGASAQARIAGPEAGANAIVLEAVIEVNSKAVAAEAGASAGVTLENLGAKAEASVTLGKAAIGIKHTPFKAHIQGPSASGEAGVSWDYTGGNVGISAGEARAGPFAARAGVKFGGGVRNGVPEVDLGPVTAPCSVM